MVAVAPNIPSPEPAVSCRPTPADKNIDTIKNMGMGGIGHGKQVQKSPDAK